MDSAYAGAGTGSNADPDCLGTNVFELTIAGYANARILGANTTAGLLVESDATIIGLTITGCSTKPAIKLRCVNKGIVVSQYLAGSSGNSDVGLDLTNAQNCTVYIQSTPTVTGTLGDIRLADGTIVSWATAMTGIIDTAGNKLWGGGNTHPEHFQPVAVGSVTVTWNNAPAGSAAAPVRYVKIPDGQGGFYTFGSLT